MNRFLRYITRPVVTQLELYLFGFATALFASGNSVAGCVAMVCFVIVPRTR